MDSIKAANLLLTFQTSCLPRPASSLLLDWLSSRWQFYGNWKFPPKEKYSFFPPPLISAAAPCRKSCTLSPSLRPVIKTSRPGNMCSALTPSHSRVVADPRDLGLRAFCRRCVIWRFRFLASYHVSGNVLPRNGIGMFTMYKCIFIIYV